MVMADIATYDEGIECQKAGASCLSTTLNGYTPETAGDKDNGPNYSLLESLASSISIPVFAEGRVNTPDAAARMTKAGAWAIIAGSAITRPTLITQWYINAINAALVHENN